MVDDVVVVDDRMNHRHLILVAGEGQVIDRARVEVAAAADAGQIKLRDRFRRQAQERAQRVLVLGQPVVREEVVIRQQDAVPAPDPFVVDRELAFGVEAAAELAVAGLTGVGALVELIDAVGADLVGAVDQALAEFALEQHALPGGEARTEGRVIIRRDRPVERGIHAVAIAGDRREGRHQEAGLALDGRIGRREIRQIRHRHAEELELCVFEVQHLVGLVVDDARTLDLPQRRLLRIVLARRAGGIHAVFEHGVIAGGAVGARRRHPRRVLGVDAQRIDEPVTVVVAQIHDIGVGDFAFRVGQADVAFRMQPLGLLVIDDLVGLHAGAVVEHLHVADRRHALVVVIVVHLDRLHEHPAVVVGRPWRRLGRPRIVGEALRRGRHRQGKLDRARENESAEQRKHRNAKGSHASSIAAHIGAPPERRRPQLAGGDNGHYPSSWYNKAKKPVRPPTQTGNHAAAIGCINSALLKSSVTFDRT